jgi:hypothetical protein
MSPATAVYRAPIATIARGIAGKRTPEMYERSIAISSTMIHFVAVFWARPFPFVEAKTINIYSNLTETYTAIFTTR